MVILDNYDGEALGTSPPANWVRDSHYNGGAGRIHIVTNQRFWSSPHSMRCYCADAEPFVLVMHRNVTLGLINSEFEMYFHTDSNNGGYFALQGTAGDYDALHEMGNIEIGPSGAWIKVNGIRTGRSYTSGWHNIKIKTFVETGLFDVYFDYIIISSNNPLPTSDRIIHSIQLGTYLSQTFFFDDISISPIPSVSALGRLRLGSSVLGAALGSISHTESIKIEEENSVKIYTFNSDAIECQDKSWVEMIASLVDEVELAQEFLWYPVLDQIGVQVRIVQPIDITMDDFCDFVFESGHGILLNGANARAFVNVQQKEQTFRGNEKVYAGDAVMFNCPSLEIKVGDIITHAFREYEIIEIHEKLIGGNYIYLKSALKLKTLPLTMPKVTGLKVSPNIDGTVLLTWDDISNTIYPSFDHFEIWKSPIHPITAVNQVLKTFTISGEYSEFFTAGETFNVTGSTGNNNTYTIAESSIVTGNTLIKVVEVIPSAVADGLVNKLTFKLVSTTKNANLTDKSLNAGETYFYIVRAVDKYGNAGAFSEAVMTTGDASTPPTPEGFR